METQQSGPLSLRAANGDLTNLSLFVSNTPEKIVSEKAVLSKKGNGIENTKLNGF